MNFSVTKQHYPAQHPHFQSHESPLIILKIGGMAMDYIHLILQDIITLPYRWVIVHGGGRQVNEISRDYGIEPRFEHGVRQTSSNEMSIVDMGLAGLVNTSILRRASSMGIDAVGLSGVDARSIISQKVSEDNYTGFVVEVRTNLIDHLLQGGYLPVISSVSTTVLGEGVNINADTATSELAKAFAQGKEPRVAKPHALLFLSDTPGVLEGPQQADSGRVVQHLNIAEARRLIKVQTITGGMIAKIESAIACLQEGVERVIIGNIHEKGDLNRMINGKRGTQVLAN